MSGEQQAVGPSPDARDDATTAGEDSAGIFDLHVADAPPLTWLSALSALIAMAIGHVLVPALSDPSQRELAFRLGRWGDFAVNLAAISGLIALSFGLYAFVRYSTVISLRQRLLLAGFAGIFEPTIAIATVFERQRTTTQIVLFALGAAYVVGTMVNSAAARARENRYARGVAVLAAAMAMMTMIAQVLRLMTRSQLEPWKLQAFEVFFAGGELAYLLLLLGLCPLAIPGRHGLRNRVGRIAIFFFTPVFLGGLYLAERQLRSDYTLLLYHAQRVNLFIDEWPQLYSVPLAMGTAVAIGGALSSDPVRRQGAAALCLLVAAGFSPHAPGRLLSLTLALILVARTVIAPIERMRLDAVIPID